MHRRDVHMPLWWLIHPPPVCPSIDLSGIAIEVYIYKKKKRLVPFIFYSSNPLCLFLYSPSIRVRPALPICLHWAIFDRDAKACRFDRGVKLLMYTYTVYLVLHYKAIGFVFIYADVKRLC